MFFHLLFDIIDYHFYVTISCLVKTKINKYHYTAITHSSKKYLELKYNKNCENQWIHQVCTRKMRSLLK